MKAPHEMESILERLQQPVRGVPTAQTIVETVAGFHGVSRQDIEALRLVLAPLPADPEARRLRIGEFADWHRVQRVIDEALRGVYGHTMQHHCLRAMPTSLDPVRVIGQFLDLSGAKGSKPIRKVVTAISVGVKTSRFKAVTAITAEHVLRARVIGLDPVTLLLPDSPEKTTSCAFRTESAVTAAAEWMARCLLAYLGTGRHDTTMEFPFRGGTCRIVWNPSLNGWAITAPIGLIGDPVAVDVLGYETDHKFGEFVATIKELRQQVTDPKRRTLDRDLCSAVLFALIEQVTRPVNLEAGSIRAIFKSHPDADPPFKLFSMYPEA